APGEETLQFVHGGPSARTARVRQDHEVGPLGIGRENAGGRPHDGSRASGSRRSRVAHKGRKTRQNRHDPEGQDAEKAKTNFHGGAASSVLPGWPGRCARNNAAAASLSTGLEKKYPCPYSHFKARSRACCSGLSTPSAT